MPHTTMKFQGGVDVNETPVLNQAGISSCNLIRYKVDANALLVEKTGGWEKFFTNQTVAPVRALWAWEDTQSSAHLAVGTENQVSPVQAQLSVITDGVQSNITPRATTDNVTPAVASTSGSSILVVTDATTGNITNYDSVYITTHIAIGGVILFGIYACNPDAFSGSTTYHVQAHDKLGNPLAATATSSTTTVASFATTSGLNTVSVTLTGHGYMAGDTYPVLVSTTVGGITFYGNYIVQSVTSANVFVIAGGNTASSTTTGSINGGNARYIYSFGIGAIPTGTGYGIGGYGRGGYGTGTAITPSTGTAISAEDWTLDNWGEILISCPIETGSSPPFQPIYTWNPESGSPIATVIPNGPPVNDGAFVAMPERQIIAWGSTFTGIPDPLLLRWCDINNYNVWIGQVTNQAGSFRIPRGSRIVAGIQGPQQGVIWTDVGVWTMQYINQPYVWSFNEVGNGCGLISRKAAGVSNGVIYWMGPSQFFTLGDEGVVPVPCPIWDVIFQNLDTDNTDKIRFAVNSRFNEIAWFYPSLAGSGEVDSYVKFNTLLGANGWDYGSLARSAWIDQSVLGPPIGADPSNRYIYQHETSTDADGAALLASFRSGYFAMNDGDLKTFVDQIWPDMKFGYYGGTMNATVNITFYAADYPGQTPTTYGPYPFTQATSLISPRIRARLLAIELSSSDVGSWWRIGGVRYRFSQDGKY